MFFLTPSGFFQYFLLTFVDYYIVDEFESTDANTVVFKLDVKCDVNPNAKPGSLDPADMYRNSTGDDFKNHIPIPSLI